MELIQYIFKCRLEILPGIIAQVVGAQHQVDAVVLPAAQALVDGNHTVRSGDDLFAHIGTVQTDRGQEGSLGDAGRVPEALHAGVSDEYGVGEIRVIHRRSRFFYNCGRIDLLGNPVRIRHDFFFLNGRTDDCACQSRQTRVGSGSVLERIRYVHCRHRAGTGTVCGDCRGTVCRAAV